MSGFAILYLMAFGQPDVIRGGTTIVPGRQMEFAGPYAGYGGFALVKTGGGVYAMGDRPPARLAIVGSVGVATASRK